MNTKEDKVIEISPCLFILGGFFMKDTYLYFVKINENYLNYLKSFDKNIRDKSNRPYIGIVLKYLKKVNLKKKNKEKDFER